MHLGDTYQFQKIGEDGFIRLLDLKSATSADADIHCELIKSDRRVAVEYEAVSYVWGKAEFSNTLYLPGGCLMITHNLALALRRLRRSDKSRRLWVDAVCINQFDDVEKGQQMAQMASIYKNATKVVAWLGERSGTSLDKEAILSLSRHAQEIGLRSPMDENRDIILKWVYGNSERVNWMMHVSSAAEHANLPLVYESAWFTRMWIVQEAVLASHLILYFGVDTLDWVDFERAMILLHTVNAAIRLPIPSRDSFIKSVWSLIEVRDHWQRSAQGNPNQALEVAFYMSQLRRRSCQDGRDRVFALQGLLRGESNLIIQPDYSKTVVQVYIELARSLLGLGNIGVLYEAGLWRRKSFQIPDLRPENSTHASWSEYLPTWVPDYRNETAFMEVDIKFGSYFGTDPKVPQKLDLSKEPHRLTSQATLIDIISFVQPAMFVHDEAFRANDIAMFFKCCELCKELKKVVDSRFGNGQYPTNEDPTTAFAYALVGGGTDEAYDKSFRLKVTDERPDPFSLWKLYEERCLKEDGEVHQAMRRELGMTANRKTLRGIGVDFYRELSAESGKAWSYSQHLVSLFRRHWFFISDDGYIGLAPRTTQSVGGNDVLAFIDGANVPFVLRDLGKDTSDYVLVGPCYIHGLMDSETIKRNEAFSVGTVQII